MMEIYVRKAEEKDIDRILSLLKQVLEIHAAIRPDIFVSGTTKYTKEELKMIFTNEETPVFVAADRNDTVLGYVFCMLQVAKNYTNMKDRKTLYIDDLCVDQNHQGKHIGTTLYDYVIEYAKKQNCNDVTLNVWEGNDKARLFYEKIGMKVRKTQMEYLLEE